MKKILISVFACSLLITACENGNPKAPEDHTLERGGSTSAPQGYYEMCEKTTDPELCYN